MTVKAIKRDFAAGVYVPVVAKALASVVVKTEARAKASIRLGFLCAGHG